MAFERQQYGYSDDSDENYGEEGSSSRQLELPSQIEMVRLASEFANFNDQFNQMSVKQRTSYFVSILQFICL